MLKELEESNKYSDIDKSDDFPDEYSYDFSVDEGN